MKFVILSLTSYFNSRLRKETNVVIQLCNVAVFISTHVSARRRTLQGFADRSLPTYFNSRLRKETNIGTEKNWLFDSHFNSRLRKETNQTHHVPFPKQNKISTHVSVRRRTFKQSRFALPSAFQLTSP